MKLVLRNAELVSGLTLILAPIIPRPLRPEEWQASTLASGIPDGARVRTHPAEAAETPVCGWPVTLIVSEVVRGDEILERRLHAFYDLGLYAAVAWLRGEGAAAAREVLLAAVPDFSVDGVSVLSEVWDGF